MDCLVLPMTALRRRSFNPRMGYRILGEEEEEEQQQQQTVRVVVGKERKEFFVDPFVLEETPFRALIGRMKKSGGGVVGNEKMEGLDGRRRVTIFVDHVDAILFEHMLWLMNNDSSSLFQLNLKEIIHFYSHDF